jgi:hypothetical protein
MDFDFEAIIGTVTDLVSKIDWEEVINVVKGIFEKIVPVITGLIGNIGG